MITVQSARRNITVRTKERNFRVNQVTRAINIHQVGRRGPQGIPGAQGEQGEQGPQGIPGEDKNFTFDFTNTSEVTVNHSLSKYPAVTIMDSSGDEIMGEVEHISTGQLIARFSASFTGRIVCN